MLDPQLDAPARDACTLRRSPTNTPLQSLVTLNDPAYVEAAEALGVRMIKEGGSDPREQIVHGFRLAATRAPTERELAPLLKLREDSLRILAAEAGAADAKQMPALEQRAFAAVGAAILNLDCVLTK